MAEWIQAIAIFMLFNIFFNWLTMSLPSIQLSKKAFPDQFMIQHDFSIPAQQHFECAAYSSSFVLRFFDIVEDPLKAYERFPNKLASGCVTPKGITKFLRGKKLNVSYCKGSIATLKYQVSKGIPVIVFIRVNTKSSYKHYVPIVGYDSEFVYIAESLESLKNCTEEKLSYNRKVKIDEFMQLWDVKDLMTPFYSNTYFVVSCG